MTCLVYYGKEVQIEEELTIGRKDSNSLVIEENTISKRHAVIKKLDNTYYLVDVGSTNGTFLNHKKISVPTPLENSDLIQLGNVQLVFNTKNEEEEDDRTLLSNDEYIVNSIVLVSDIKGYTNFSESVPINVVKKFMENWIKEITNIVKSQGGFVDNILGDCLYARWDKNVDKENLKNTVKCVILISKLTKDLSETLLSSYTNHDLKIGAAIHVGEVILGDNSFLPSGISDTVNTTFRLESLTREFKVDLILSDEAFKILDCNIIVEEDEVDIKGKKDKLKIQKINYGNLEIALNA
jgi:adenylate cyclase